MLQYPGVGVPARPLVWMSAALLLCHLPAYRGTTVGPPPSIATRTSTPFVNSSAHPLKIPPPLPRVHPPTSAVSEADARGDNETAPTETQVSGLAPREIMRMNNVRRNGNDPKRVRRNANNSKRVRRRNGNNSKRVRRNGNDPKRVRRNGNDPKRVRRNGNDPKRVRRNGNDSKRVKRRNGNDSKRVRRRNGNDSKRVRRNGNDSKRVRRRNGDDSKRIKRNGIDSKGSFPLSSESNSSSELYGGGGSGGTTPDRAKNVSERGLGSSLSSSSSSSSPSSSSPCSRPGFTTPGNVKSVSDSAPQISRSSDDGGGGRRQPSRSSWARPGVPRRTLVGNVTRASRMDAARSRSQATNRSDGGSGHSSPGTSAAVGDVRESPNGPAHMQANRATNTAVRGRQLGSVSPSNSTQPHTCPNCTAHQPAEPLGPQPGERRRFTGGSDSDDVDHPGRGKLVGYVPINSTRRRPDPSDNSTWVKEDGREPTLTGMGQEGDASKSGDDYKSSSTVTRNELIVIFLSIFAIIGVTAGITAWLFHGDN